MPFVAHQGIQIHYETSGAGDPLLLLHGLGGSTEDWAPQVAAFASHYQVI